MNATCTVAAGSTLELVKGTASPLGLPVPEGPQLNRVPEETEKEKRTDVGGRERSGRSKTAVEQRRAADTATGEEQRRGRRQEPERKCLGLPAIPAVAQEAHSETSIHASGEAWHTQVRPETNIEKQGLLGGGTEGNEAGPDWQAPELVARAPQLEPGTEVRRRSERDRGPRRPEWQHNDLKPSGSSRPGGWGGPLTRTGALTPRRPKTYLEQTTPGRTELQRPGECPGALKDRSRRRLGRVGAGAAQPLGVPAANRRQN
ncbi:hypothetical protein NDU88_006656 [Pleurodeles waltl]|uniref:Uncharacterized protein n=1 Tax=Pleurodeles waltl TaxID=8319 RepID=A0AAV7RSH2_PLEWA|nr:hypothetical protein NDU88_006656 [Pleurodeles waltl]